MQLEGKVALVTGGGRGICRGIVERFLDEGAHVVVAQREALEAPLDSHPRIAGIQTDLSAPPSTAAAVEYAVARFGGLDILVNNAGIMFENTVSDIQIEEWDLMFNINLRAPMFLIQAALPQMRKRGGGSIINVGSIEGLGANPHHTAYCASKAGIHGLTAAVWFVRQLVRSPFSHDRTVRHDRLVGEVTGLFNEEKGRAGRDQLTRMLNNNGVDVSAPTVGAIMREHGLKAARTRAWKKTTEQDPQAKTAHIKNHMLDEDGKRDFTSTVPGTRLCGDITYLRTGEGWLYLATVIDLCTGMVIGWSMADHMRAELCTEALAMARDHGRLASDGAIFHSDSKNVRCRVFPGFVTRTPIDPVVVSFLGLVGCSGTPPARPTVSPEPCDSRRA
ncbi:SDR family NAD(P)-dependent oxidoreductase [Arthrobacter sp. UYEF3]|uniref:SDR family NAD(P)-dependent oxidoreductase n=1 Tax=Arthrobacter sp. UYEF3 TaxID=1756365 RepID=UPI0033970D74